MNCELIFSAQEFLKLVPGIAIFPISFYLAVKKIGTGVSFSYVWSMNNIGERVSSVVLVNRKDKPVIIRGIILRCEGVEMDLHTFSEPLILKAYESTRIIPDPYSTLILNGKPWNIPHKASTPNIDLFLILPNGKHKCLQLFKKPWLTFKKSRPFLRALKYKVEHNGIVYNPDLIRFIVVYEHKEQQITTFIERSGFISEAIGLGIRTLTQEEMISPEVAENTLKRATPGLVVNVFWPKNCLSVSK